MMNLLQTRLSARSLQRWTLIGILWAALIVVMTVNSIYYFANGTTTLRILTFGFAACTSGINLFLGSFIWLYTSHYNKPLTRCFFWFTCSLAFAFAAETSAANNVLFFSILASISSVSAFTAISLFFFFFPELVPTEHLNFRWPLNRSISIDLNITLGCIAALSIFLYELGHEMQASLYTCIRLCFLGISLCALSRILYTWWYCVHYQQRQQLQQIKWIVGSFLLGVIPFWIFTLLPQYRPSLRAIVPLLGEIITLPLVIFLLALCTALLRYQLLIFTTYIRKSLIILVHVIVYVIVFYTCLLLTDGLSDLWGPHNPHIIFQYGLIILIALSGSILSWKFAEPLIDRIFFQDIRRYRIIFNQSLYSSLLSVDDIAQIITSTAIEAFNVPQVNLYLLDEVQAVYRLTPALSSGSRELFSALFRQTLGQMLYRRLGQLEPLVSGEEIDLNHPAISQLTDAPRPLFLQEMAPNDSARRLKLGRYLSPEGSQPGDTILLAPISIKKRIIAILVLGEREQHRTYASEDFAILELLFNRFSPMLESARLAAQRQHYNELLNNLYSASSLASNSYMVSTIEQTARRYAISVSLAIAGRAEVWLQQTPGHSQRYTNIVSEGTVPRILSSSSLSLTAEEDWNACFFETYVPEQKLPSPFATAPLYSCAWLPLLNDESRIGILLLTYGRPHFFSPSERRALQLFASSFMVALENARMTNELQETYKRQQDLDHMQDRFIDEVTKQLRIPLTQLHQDIEQIEQQHATLPDEQRGQLIKHAYKASEDLSVLLNTIFSVSAPHKDINFEALELLPFIQDIIAELNIPDQPISYSIPAGTLVSTDRELFHQIYASILKQIIVHAHQTLKISAQPTFVHINLIIECIQARDSHIAHMTFSQALITSLLKEINATLEVSTTASGNECITILLPKAQDQDDIP